MNDFVTRFRESLKTSSAAYMATFTEKQAQQQKLVEQAYQTYKRIKNLTCFESWQEKQNIQIKAWMRYCRRVQRFEQMRKDNI